MNEHPGLIPDPSLVSDKYRGCCVCGDPGCEKWDISGTIWICKRHLNEVRDGTGWLEVDNANRSILYRYGRRGPTISDTSEHPGLISDPVEADTYRAPYLPSATIEAIRPWIGSIGIGGLELHVALKDVVRRWDEAKDSEVEV